MKRIRSTFSYLCTKTIQRSMSLISYGFWLKNSLFYASCFRDLDALLNFKKITTLLLHSSDFQRITRLYLNQNHFTIGAFLIEKISTLARSFLWKFSTLFSIFSKITCICIFVSKITNACYVFCIKNSQRFYVFHVFIFHADM